MGSSFVRAVWAGFSCGVLRPFLLSALCRLSKDSRDQGLWSWTLHHLGFRANYSAAMPKPVDLDYDPDDVEMRQVTVRMPAALYEAVKQRAAQDMRPVAQAMRFALREYANG